MDPDRHANPRTFDPSRYATDHRTFRESAICENPKERDHYLFGAGRRVCMGMDIAENSLFLGMARMLWAFNFEKAIGEDGKEVTPDAEDLVGGLAASPSPFPVKIVARSDERGRLVKEQWEEAQLELSSDDKQWKRVLPDLRFGKYEPRRKQG